MDDFSDAALAAWEAERDEALLSMDETKLRAYHRKWNQKELSVDPEIFWAAVHKARTAAKTLPMAARSESKRWLLARGLKPWDDGDVPTEEKTP